MTGTLSTQLDLRITLMYPKKHKTSNLAFNRPKTGHRPGQKYSAQHRNWGSDHAPPPLRLASRHNFNSPHCPLSLILVQGQNWPFTRIIYYNQSLPFTHFFIMYSVKLWYKKKYLNCQFSTMGKYRTRSTSYINDSQWFMLVHTTFWQENSP